MPFLRKAYSVGSGYDCSESDIWYGRSWHSLSCSLARVCADTPADEELDDLVEIGRRTLGTAACAINFVDSDRQWTKAACGLTTKVWIVIFGALECK